MSEQSVKPDASGEVTFEVAFAELEAVVEQLEEGELSLEESISLYERGQMLARLCQERLDRAELRMDQIGTEGKAGEYGADGLLC
jgi:exodeoxyribonuclease VII small subunit